MDWTWYLFGFEGRINRAKYWLAGLIVLALMIAFVGLVYSALMINFVAHAMGTPNGKGEVSFGFDLDDIFLVLDPAAWRALSLAKLPMVLVKAAGMVLFLWIFCATAVKRLHDRDKSAWWMVPFFVLPNLYNHFSDQLPDSWFMLVPSLIMFVLDDVGFRRTVLPARLAQDQPVRAEPAPAGRARRPLGPEQRDRNGAAPRLPAAALAC